MNRTVTKRLRRIAVAMATEDSGAICPQWRIEQRGMAHAPKQPAVLFRRLLTSTHQRQHARQSWQAIYKALKRDYSRGVLRFDARGVLEVAR